MKRHGEWRVSSLLSPILATTFKTKLPAEEVKVSTANPSFTIEAAFDVFYSQPQPKSNGDMRLLEELFNRYKGNMLFLMCFTVSHSPRHCHGIGSIQGSGDASIQCIWDNGNG